MSEIDIEAFAYAVEKIDNGRIFEDFALSFLSAVLGYEFIPVGGTKDRGIDGLQYVYKKGDNVKKIYQLSTELDSNEKIKKSIEKLIQNKIDFDSFCYVTNRIVPKKDNIVDELNENFKVQVNIFDLKWFSAHASDSEATINAYNVYIASYFHEFNQPGKVNVVSNLHGDPRLFVFLRQQLENREDNIKIDELLADSLILYSLEGTDPDRGIMLTSNEIKEKMKGILKFNPQILEEVIDRRLKVLSTKPRKIKYHSKENAYVLPYETRLEIQNKDIKDKLLHEKFNNSVEEKIRKYLKETDTIVKDLAKLVDDTIHKIFYDQGLEFANFIIHNEQKDFIDKELPDIIGKVVDESSVVNRNKEDVKVALLMAIRDIVYNGTVDQKRYFRSLSNTYLMMFLLQWDPQISTYFNSLAAKLEVFVCTSVIIPALSEFYLRPENRRYWNLLKGARGAGITLIVNETIINELAAHFNMIKHRYEVYFKDYEDLYLTDEFQMLYIDDILIRAYFYAKMRGQVKNFYNFIDNIVGPDLTTIKEDLITFLREEFGIRYYSKAKLGVTIDQSEKERLFHKLKEYKNAAPKAENDAELILTIYKLREKNNEHDSSSIFGYKTWWLSTDTKTYMVIPQLFKNKYTVSCYMRPDFLYNYIALMPKKAEVDDMYREIFPSLLGINLSFHLPASITEFIQEKIVEHGEKNPARVISIIRNLSDKLKSEPNFRKARKVEQFWDEEIKRIAE